MERTQTLESDLLGSISGLNTLYDLVWERLTQQIWVAQTLHIPQNGLFSD